MYNNFQRGRGNYNNPAVDQSLCRGCGICLNACPVRAISMKNGKAVINDSLCIGCRRCVSVCPVHAIR